MFKLQFDDVVAVESKEDGGRGLVARLDPPNFGPLFVRLQSWDEAEAHPEFRALVGRAVRVTIEELPPATAGGTTPPDAST